MNTIHTLKQVLEEAIDLEVLKKLLDQDRERQEQGSAGENITAETQEAGSEQNTARSYIEYCKEYLDSSDRPALTLFYGASGSGKTVSMHKYVDYLRLMTDEHTEVTVIDGKGGTEWEADFADVLADERDAVAIYRYFRNLRKAVELAMATETMINRIVVIDEGQELFDTRGRSSAEIELVELTQEALSKVVKLGRLVGLHIVIASQKQTSDGLHISIRNNAMFRFVLNVNTVQEEIAALGAVGSPSPCDIQYKEVGLAVVQDSNGRRELVQF